MIRLELQPREQKYNEYANTLSNATTTATELLLLLLNYNSKSTPQDLHILKCIYLKAVWSYI